MTMQYENQMMVLRALLVRCDEAEYANMLSCWDAFVAAARPDVQAKLSLPLSYEDYRHFQNIVLTPGMPYSLPPVESLYKDWGGRQAGIQYGQGFYLGDSAHNAEALCRSLEIAIPRDFYAMPDHLVLLLELYVFLSEHAAAQDVQSFVASHFDWLRIYRDLLAKRVAKEDDICLVRASDFYQYVITYIEDMVTSEQVAQSA